MSEAPEQARRRRFVVGSMALVVLGIAGARLGYRAVFTPQSDLAFQPMETPAGYQILKGGAVSLAGGVPLFGLDSEKPAGLLIAEKTIADDLEGALFTLHPPSQVPIAYFFDYQCPICRRLTPRLRTLNDVSVSWHDLAGLGPASETAARATIAAGSQGAYDAFHDRLMRARFQATDGYVESLAGSVGIDPARLLADMYSDAVDQRMWLSRALANLFGMVGTPGMVIGKSVVIGDVSDRELDLIIAMERRR